LMSIAVKPYTALVTCPDEVTSVSGKAKKARNASEWPSSNNTLWIAFFSLPAGLRLDFATVFFALLTATF
jgi:hypothetical protein